MKDLVEFLAKSLVEHPDAVVVTEEQRGDATVYRLRVDPSDVGKVIGRQGRIAKSIRNVVSAAAYRQNKHVFVDIES
ncbi:MAG: KH domain-containing protein [Alicyclobacillus sp.]|nr:KH domain-containing protein [Alicyclobacillus sp.]